MSAAFTAGNQLAAVAGGVLEKARRLGASAAEAVAGTESSLSVDVRMGAVETISHGNEREVSVTVYFDKCKGSASVSDFSEQSVGEAVKTACNIARYTSRDDYSGLADAGSMATEFPDLDLDRRWDIEIRQAIDIATECEDEMRAADKIDNTEGASVSTARGEQCYANTHGFSRVSSGTRHSISGVAVAKGKDGMQRDFWYSVHRHPDRLQSPAEIGRRAASRAAKRLGACRVKTCRVPVLFEAPIARSLLSELASAISGGALYRKASFLLGSLGERLFPEFVNIVERPHLPGAMGSASFDSEGVATREHGIVESGVLTSYLLDSYSARRLGMETTGNAGGLHNWVFAGGTRPAEALPGEIGEGFLVTELMGYGVNLVTGDYSRGASGFWVENGEITYPVSEVTIAANLRDMFRGIAGVGDDVDARGNIICGSILIDGMTVAGD